MVKAQRTTILNWIAPAFLLTLGAVFVLAPWSLMDKLHAVCFGI